MAQPALQSALPQFGLEDDAEWLGTVVGIRRLSDLQYVTEPLLQSLDGTPVAKSKLGSMAAAYRQSKVVLQVDVDSRGAEDKREAESEAAFEQQSRRGRSVRHSSLTTGRGR